VNDRWFANRGQIIQAVLALIACILAGLKAFPDFQRSHFFTIGSLLFIFIVAWVVAFVVQVGMGIHRQHVNTEIVNSILPAEAPKLVEPAVSTQLFSYTCGISRVGMGTEGFWIGKGSVNGATIEIKNETNIVLRKVEAFARFYDEKGRQIANSRPPWIDEKHDNTGFAVGEAHSVLLAVHAKQDDNFFSLPDGERLEEENISVRFRLFVDDARGGSDEIYLKLSTQPFFGLTVVTTNAVA